LPATLRLLLWITAASEFQIYFCIVYVLLPHREIDFLFKILLDSWTISPVEWSYLNTDMRKFEPSQKDESKAQSADSKAYRKPSRAGVTNLYATESYFMVPINAKGY